MITEFIRMTVPSGTRDDFLGAFAEVSPAYYAQEGCLENKLYTQTDDPDAVLGMIVWTDHAALDAALASEAGKTFLATVVPRLAGPPEMRFGEPA